MSLKPYYEHNEIIVFNDDCLKVMDCLPANSIDLTVTSPPYDNLRAYNGIEWHEAIWQELFGNYSESLNSGVVVWIVGDATVNGSETGTSFKQALWAMECGFNLHDTMIYEKSGMAYPESTRYHNVFEYMFVFSKGKPATVNIIKDRDNKYKGLQGGNKRGGLCFRSEYGARFNVWKFANGRDNSSKDREAFKHPAIFPEKLAQDHIISWSNEGDIVLDCFAGSGTTLKMAKQLGRKAIGIEISKEYCDITVHRLQTIEPRHEGLPASSKQNVQLEMFE